MSDNTTCQHCGAPIEPNSSICPYCGSTVAAAQSGPFGKWVAVSDRMPPIDPSDPGKTIVVFIDACVSAYYDLKKRKWINDMYGDKLSYKRLPQLIADYWMPLPPSTLPEWVSIKDYSPEALVKDACSIFVLACRKGPHYESSLTMAQIDYDITHEEGVWTGLINLDSDNIEDQMIDVTHWMPMPPDPPKK